MIHPMQTNTDTMTSKPSNPILEVKPSVSDSKVNKVMEKIIALEKELKASLETAPGIVEVILTVTDFREVLQTRGVERGTFHTVTISKGKDVVSVEEGADMPKLKIKKDSGPVTFRFKIVDAKTDDVYQPLGIAFKEERSAKSPSTNKTNMIGENNFPLDRMHIYGNNLYITDLYLPEARDLKYKFSVIFQRERDAKIGIIDPGIEHENND